MVAACVTNNGEYAVRQATHRGGALFLPKVAGHIALPLSGLLFRLRACSLFVRAFSFLCLTYLLAACAGTSSFCASLCAVFCVFCHYIVERRTQ